MCTQARLAPGTLKTVRLDLPFGARHTKPSTVKFTVNSSVAPKGEVAHSLTLGRGDSKDRTAPL